MIPAMFFLAFWAALAAAAFVALGIKRGGAPASAPPPLPRPSGTKVEVSRFMPSRAKISAGDRAAINIGPKTVVPHSGTDNEGYYRIAGRQVSGPRLCASDRG